MAINYFCERDVYNEVKNISCFITDINGLAVGVARLNPIDKFDIVTGKQIAYARAKLAGLYKKTALFKNSPQARMAFIPATGSIDEL